MKKVLYVDMDETVANFKERMIELFPFTEHIFNEEETYENGVIIEDCMFKSPRMFRDLEPIEGAVESVLRLSEFYDIYFLSTPFWEVPESFMDKRHWLEEHFGDMCYKRLILSHRKDLSMGSYLIDDRLANGSEKFTGEHIHFDTKEFPNWEVVEAYLMAKLKPTTVEGFNDKWSDYLEDRHYGLAFDDEEVIKYLDSEFEKEILVNPDFSYSQIKLKFGMSRVYAYSDKTNVWEEEIDKMLKGNNVI